MVSIATRMAQGFESQQGQKIFVPCTMLRPAVGLTQPHFSGYRWVFARSAAAWA
jgi:hypothetical protein